MFPNLEVNAVGAVNNDSIPNTAGTAEPAEEQIEVFDAQPEAASVDSTTFGKTEESTEPAPNNTSFFEKITGYVKEHPIKGLLAAVLGGLPAISFMSERDK